MILEGRLSILDRTASIYSVNYLKYVRTDRLNLSNQKILRNINYFTSPCTTMKSKENRIRHFIINYNSNLQSVEPGAQLI